MPQLPRKDWLIFGNSHWECIYIKNYIKYKALNLSDDFPIQILNSSPNIYDRFEDGGHIPKHYFLQDLWMAKRIYKRNPVQHYDIGSRLDGFISHCLVFTDVSMLDIRDISTPINGLSFIKTDATDMSNIQSDSIESISSLHAVEHFGLGRYSDPINPDGYKMAIKEIQRVANNDIYFSVPIGKPRLMFDAHRIFNPIDIVNLFDQCELFEFAAIDDLDQLIVKADFDQCLDFDYGCGLFHFKKKRSNNVK